MQQREPRERVSRGTVELQRDSSAQPPHEYPIVNISRGGLCFQSNDSYELNEVVNFNIRINQQEIIHSASGRVCYRNETPQEEPVYGLSFLDHFLDSDALRS